MWCNKVSKVQSKQKFVGKIIEGYVLLNDFPLFKVFSKLGPQVFGINRLTTRLFATELNRVEKS